MTPFRVRTFALLAGLVLAAAVPLNASAAPPSVTWTLSQIKLTGCNQLWAYYQVNSNGWQLLGNNAGILCETVRLSRVRLTGLQGTDVVNVKIIDVTCGTEYDEDGGGTADHANQVTQPSGAERIDILDGGGGCSNQSTPISPLEGAGNLTLLSKKQGG